MFQLLAALLITRQVIGNVKVKEVKLVSFLLVFKHFFPGITAALCQKAVETCQDEL